MPPTLFPVLLLFAGQVVGQEEWRAAPYTAGRPPAGARTLMAANVNAAIVRAPLPEGRVLVGDVSQLAQSLDDPAEPKAEEKPRAKEKPKGKEKPARTIKVGRGDTLGKIADRHDCSLKELAKANGLRAPGYTVKPGQRIKLEGCGK